VHGTEDEILPDSCSRNICARAQEPKELRLCPGCPGLDQCRAQVDEDVVGWLLKHLAADNATCEEG